MFHPNKLAEGKVGIFSGNINSKVKRVAALAGVSIALLGLPKGAKADENSYPWRNAAAAASEKYTWWIDENNDGIRQSWPEDFDPYGFNYRNCTSYAAWKVKKEFGVTIPSSWGSADTWDDQAKGTYPVDVGGAEAGDLAVWDNMHVAFVESVNPDGTVNTSEYNWQETGEFGTRSNVQADHYIDINGEGVSWSGGNSGDGAPAPANNGLVSYNSIADGTELYAQNGWIYTKIGGSVIPIKHQNWTKGDTEYWGNHPIGPVSNGEIHDHEVGYDRNGRTYAAHAPRDGTPIYDEYTKTQYYFLNGKAWEVTYGEIDDLGMRNRALMFPSEHRRLDDYKSYASIVLPDRSIFRYAGTQRVNLMSQHPDGSASAYHVNNEAVKYCLELTEQQSHRILPNSMRPYIVDQRGTRVPELGNPAACAFPPQIVLKTPEDATQFRLTGNNSSEPYVLHRYPTPLLTYLHTNGSPDLRTTKAIYGLSQGSGMTPPEGAFFRNSSDGKVFRSAGGIYQWAFNEAVLACHGNPSNIINVPWNVMEGMPQGAPLACSYTNRLIYGPDGRQFYITPENRKQYVGNTAISACIAVRRGAGNPVQVPQSTVDNDYPSDSRAAWCPYETQRGLNFIKEHSRPEVYLVKSDGNLHHAQALCPNPGNEPRLRVYEVPDGETGGNTRGPAWSPTPEACAAMPG